MTILVAVKKNGRVFLGADRITTFGNEYFTDLVNGSKIIRLKHAYLATSGYTLLDNVVEHLHATGHAMMENTFEDRSKVFTFFLELYQELRKAYTLVDTGKDTFAGIYNTFLIVTPRNIYGISNNLSVHEFDRFAAHGSGADYALGCLYGTYDTIDDGFELARLALESACHFSVYCKEPLDIIEVSAKDFDGKARSGYKEHGKALKTITKRRTPGSLVEAAKRASRKAEKTAGAITKPKKTKKASSAAKATTASKAAGAKEVAGSKKVAVRKPAGRRGRGGSS